MAENAKRAVLEQAAQRLTKDELALWLDATEVHLEAWMQGLAMIPDREFRLLSDLLDKLGHTAAKN